MYDVIIIGAGAAGLMAAKDLSNNSVKVLILEGRNRIGGRIYTIHDEAFSMRIEAGAEFIHGKLNNTLHLLNDAGTDYKLVGGHSWQLNEGKIKQGEDFEYWDEMMKKLKALEKDEPIATFLNKHFNSDKYSVLRKTVLNFVEGYDAADTQKASAKALYKEWSGEDDEHQYRIKEGYIKLVEYLESECKKHDVRIVLNNIVKKIQWKQNNCNVITNDGIQYLCKKIVCTVPLSILRSNKEALAHFNFEPTINTILAQAKEIGYGGIIKIVIEFKQAFWEEIITSNQLKDVGFIFSEAEIPTWWSQLPYSKKILTGWLGGPKAEAIKNISDEEFFEKTLTSLQQIFACEREIITTSIKKWKVFNWFHDPFSLGAYSYPMLHTSSAKEILSEPVANTIFFAGEALYNGTQAGTVEGALQSGAETAKRVLRSLNE